MRAEANDAIDEPVLQIEGVPADTEGKHSDGVNGERETNGSAAGGDNSIGDNDDATSESSETTLEEAQRADNNLLREKITARIEAEGESEDIDDDPGGESFYDDDWIGQAATLKELICSAVGSLVSENC